MTNMKTFEKFLENECWKNNPQVLDDDMPDFFDNWLVALTGEQWLFYGQMYKDSSEIR